VKALSSSYSIDFADNLYQVLAKVSNRLTELVRDFAKRKGLDPSVEVEISLKRFIEPEVEEGPEAPRIIICGYYAPVSKRIVLSYPCIANESDHVAALKTLAHELIHHCQYTCSTQLCKDICEKSLTIDEASKIHEMLPYLLRPHEIEAYTKQDRVADEIRKVIGSEVETIIRRLDATLWLPTKEIANQLSKINDLYSNIRSAHIAKPNLSSPLTQFVENLLNRFVGREAMAKSIATALNTVKDEDIRNLIELVLSVNNFITSYTEALSKECWDKSVEVTSIAIIPVQDRDKPRSEVFVVTNAGFAISFTLNAEAPLATVKLKPRNKLSLSSLQQHLNSLNDTYLLHLAHHDKSSDFIAYIHADTNEQEILKEIINEMQCNEMRSSETIEKLICVLAPVLMGESIVIERLTIQDANKELIRVRSIVKNSIINEVLLCGGKVRVGDKELDKERVIKSLLNPESADKEFVEAFNKHIKQQIMLEVLMLEREFKEFKELDIQEIEKELQELEKKLKEAEKKYQELYIPVLPPAHPREETE
jgi:DNA-binding transcriptional ArsR family regulator